MPSMVVAEKEKTKDWCRQVLDAITNYMGAEGGSYHSSRVKDIRNYQIYNGVLSQGDYSYITEQYGLTYPARLVNYPIISPKIDLLLGEELRRPLDMKVTTVNKAAVIRKHDHKVGLVMRQLLGDFHKEIQETMNVDVNARYFVKGYFVYLESNLNLDTDDMRLGIGKMFTLRSNVYVDPKIVYNSGDQTTNLGLGFGFRF